MVESSTRKDIMSSVIITVSNIDSSMIDALSYTDYDNSLHVVFKGGTVYRYEGVPMETFAELEQACNSRKKSVGQVFNRLVKLAGFSYERDTAAEERLAAASA